MSYKRLLTDHWANGFAWLFWNAMGMFGLWAAGLVIFLFLENPPWLKLIDRGQFFLYSVGFLGQAMYILTKEHKITTIPHRRLLVSATVSCLIICTLLFGGNVLSNFSDSSDITTRTALLPSSAGVRHRIVPHHLHAAIRRERNYSDITTRNYYGISAYPSCCRQSPSGS